jgi:acetolactate decarboxylase
MRNLGYALMIVCFVVVLAGNTHAEESRDVLFQTSIFSALDQGVHEGDFSVKELKKRGDFGIGTFNAIDGEMVVLDGKCFQIKANGIALPASDSMRTPFAEVTFFEPDKVVSLGEFTTYDSLKKQLDKELPTKNIFHAIKISGTFKYIKARSIPPQKPPYPSLKKVFETQQILEFRNVRCTLVGFLVPAYIKGINVAGYHFHFVTEDRKAGGHVMECRLEKGVAEIDFTPQFLMILPETNAFFKAERLDDEYSF